MRNLEVGTSLWEQRDYGPRSAPNAVKRWTRVAHFGLAAFAMPGWWDEADRSAAFAVGSEECAAVIAVVIVTFNSSAMLSGLLASVRDSGATGPVIVVDNGSTDGTRELLQQEPDVEMILQGNRGYAAGVNRGILASDGTCDVLVLNPDIVVHPGALTRLQAVLDGDPSLGIVVPRLVDEAGRTTPSLRRDPSPLRTVVEAAVGGSRAGRFSEIYHAPSDGQVAPVDWAVGAAMLVRRTVLDRIGFMDESFFLYSEETEFFLRARDAGFKVVVDPLAVVQHRGGDLHMDPRLWALRAVNRVRLYRRREPPVRAFTFRAAACLFELRRALFGGGVAWRAVRELVRPDLDRRAYALAAELGADLDHLSAPTLATEHVAAAMTARGR